MGAEEDRSAIVLASVESLSMIEPCTAGHECYGLLTVEVLSVGAAVPGVEAGDRYSFCTVLGGQSSMPETLAPATLIIAQIDRAAVPVGSSLCAAAVVPDGVSTDWRIGPWYIGEPGDGEPTTAQLNDPFLNNNEVEPVALTWSEFTEVWTGLPELPESMLQGDPPSDVGDLWRDACAQGLETVTGIPPSTCR